MLVIGDFLLWRVNVVQCLMIVAMDLNASPIPEEDEDAFEEKIHAQEYIAPEERIESGADIARRVHFFSPFIFQPFGSMGMTVMVVSLFIVATSELRTYFNLTWHIIQL